MKANLALIVKLQQAGPRQEDGGDAAGEGYVGNNLKEIDADRRRMEERLARLEEKLDRAVSTNLLAREVARLETKLDTLLEHVTRASASPC